MRYLLQKLRDIRHWRDSTRQAEEYHVRSRAQMAALAAAGRSGEAIARAAHQMGATNRAHGRILSIGGVRI